MPVFLRMLAHTAASLLPLILSSNVALAGGPEVRSLREWESLWTSVLTRHVDDFGRVDFAGLAHDRNDLDRVTRSAAEMDPAQITNPASRLAFYINAYNALALTGVLEAGVPQAVEGLTKLRLFYLRTFSVGRRALTLHGFENDIIRPLGEERAHFALNCMVVSCPRLPRAAFAGGQLERQLDAATKEFVAKDSNVHVDYEARELRLSSIFSFYTGDFLAHSPTLADYINRYRTQPVPPDFRVRFADYNWTVNDLSRFTTTH